MVKLRYIHYVWSRIMFPPKSPVNTLLDIAKGTLHMWLRLRTWRWENILGCPGGPDVVNKFLKNRDAFLAVQWGRHKYGWMVREMQSCNLTGFEDGVRGLQAKEWSWKCRGNRLQGWYSWKELPCRPLDFNKTCTGLLQNCKTVQLYVF